MEYYAVVGMVVICLIAIFGVLFSLTAKVKQSVLDQKEPIHELNLSINNLSNEIKNMGKSDVIRDKRLDKHGEELDKNKEEIILVKHVQEEQEKRITKLENKN